MWKKQLTTYSTGLKISEQIDNSNIYRFYKYIQILVEHQIELGAEILQGSQSNNPLYQLADEHHLIDHSDSKFRTSTYLFQYIRNTPLPPCLKPRPIFSEDSPSHSRL